MKGWLDKYQDGQQPQILQNFEKFMNSPEGKFQFHNMESNRIAKKTSGRVDYSDIDPITDVVLPLGIAKATGLFKGVSKNVPKDAFSSIRFNSAEAPTGYVANSQSALSRDLIQPANLKEANQRIRTEMMRKNETDPYIKEYLKQNTIFGFGRNRALNKLVNAPNPNVVRTIQDSSTDPSVYNTIASTHYGKDIRLNSQLINEIYDRPVQAEKEILGHELFHNIHPSSIDKVFPKVPDIPINDYMQRMQFPSPIVDQLKQPQEILARTSEVKNKFGFKVRSDGSIRDNAGYSELTPHHFDFIKNNKDLFDVTESGVPQAMRAIDLSKVNMNRYATGITGVAAIASDQFENGGTLQEHQPNFNEASVSYPPNFEGIGNNTKGRNYSPAWGGQFADGGKMKFLQPTSKKLPKGYKPPFSDPSTELSMSVGGEEGEPSYLIPTFKYGEPLQNPVDEFRKTKEHLGGPFKTWQEAEKFGELRHKYVEKGQDIPSPIKWWGDLQEGGLIPKDIELQHIRNGAPSEGPYAKKTMPSAQNGQEMSFYQQGKDWLPRSMQLGGIVQDNNGYWNPENEGKIVEIDSPYITMKGVNQPLLGVSDTGDKKMMLPGKDYKFKGKKVQEFPIAQNGISQDKAEVPWIAPSYKILPDKENIKSELEDIYTKTTHGVSTFGGSAIGDIVQLISPKAADILQEYTLGFIPHTSEEMLQSGRSDADGAWMNRAGMASNAVASILAGEMIGAGMNKIGQKFVSGEAQDFLKAAWDKTKNLGNTVAQSIKDVYNPGQVKFQNILQRDVIKDAERQTYKAEREIDDIGYDSRRKLADYTSSKLVGNSPPHGSEKNWTIDQYKQSVAPFTLQNNSLIKFDDSNLSNVTTQGVGEIIDFETGQLVPSIVKIPGSYKKIEIGPKINQNSYTTKFDQDGNPIYTLTQEKPTRDLIKYKVSNSDLKVNEEYINTLARDIKYIEREVPGALIFGSSRGVTEAGLPHLTHDLDALISRKNFDKHVVGKLDHIKDIVLTKDNSIVRQHTIDPKFGKQGIIDFNVVEENPINGTAVGARAEEIFRQLHPDKYYAASRKAIETQGEIEIPYTPDELISSVDPTIKTILDTYEAYLNPKHINRIDSYISYGDPNKVITAQEAYVKEMVGSKGTVGYQFPLEQFSDQELNIQLLREIDFLGDATFTAKTPERMQVALNDFYINNSVLSRGVKGKDLQEVEAALKEWKRLGGEAMGAGQNHVKAGESEYGPYYGNKQLGLEWKTDSPLSYVDNIKRQTDGMYLFSPKEQQEVITILRKYNKNDSPKHPYDLIIDLKGDPDAIPILEEVAKITGRRSASTTEFGNSIYSSTLSNFDAAIDALEFTIKEKMLIPKPHELRKQNLIKTSRSRKHYDDIHSVKDFNHIKSLLESGIQKAEERQITINKLYDDFYKVLEEKNIRLSTRLIDVKTKQAEVHLAKLEKLKNDAYAKKRDLEKRINRLEEVRQMSVGLTAIVGAGYLMTELIKNNHSIGSDFRSRIKQSNPDYIKDFDKLIEEDETLKSINKNIAMRPNAFDILPGVNSEIKKEVQKELMKYNKIERQKYNQILKQIREDKGTWKDRKLESYRDESEYKNGGQLTKLDQLTNFTNYNTKQPGGWLDKYQ